MLLAVQLVCYLNLKKNQYMGYNFKQIIELVKRIYVYYNTKYDRR